MLIPMTASELRANPLFDFAWRSHADIGRDSACESLDVEAEPATFPSQKLRRAAGSGSGTGPDER